MFAWLLRCWHKLGGWVLARPAEPAHVIPNRRDRINRLTFTPDTDKKNPTHVVGTWVGAALCRSEFN